MSDDVVLRPPRSLAEMRGVRRVNARCWVEAYDHIVPDHALPDPADDPAEEWLRDRLEDARTLEATGTGRYLVAVDATAGRRGDGSVAAESAESAGSVVGFAATRWGDDTKPFVGDGEAELWVIYVDPARWGEGIGTRLLGAVTAAVPDRFDRLVLEAFADNEVGRRFYRARGFEVVEGDATDVRGDDYPAVVLARPLRD